MKHALLCSLFALCSSFCKAQNLVPNVLSAKQEFKGINYIGIIPLLVSAVKEQQNKIDSFENVIDNRLAALEQKVNYCCGTGASEGSYKTDETNDGVNRLSVELNSLQVIILEQNAPNPFAEQTSISYFVPEDVTSAQLTFTDLTGREIKTVEVQKGYGVVTVFAPNLSSGTYTYTLLVNGKAVETKKMTKQK